MRISFKNETVPESRLRNYLLGRADADMSEQLDELSVCDDAVADRLSATENDLVDAYVRGELRGAELRDFESHYLSTAMRRKKVEQARVLYVATEKVQTGAALSYATGNREPAPIRPHRWVWLRASPRWAVALALIGLLTVSTTWLAIANYGLRSQNRNTRDAFAALEKQFQQLAEQSASLHAGESQTPVNGTHPKMDGGIPITQISSLVLPPPLRGSGKIPTAFVTTTHKWLQLKLDLESDDFPEYRIDLKRWAGESSIWLNSSVKSSNIDHGRVVMALIPAETVKRTGRYAADLWGVAANGESELIGTYVFQVAGSNGNE